MSTQNLSNSTTDSCTTLLDRVQFVADLWAGRPPTIRGFRVVGDHFVPPQSAIRTYRRVREYQNQKTKTVVYLQYGCVCPWLRKGKVTVAGDDRAGLKREELDLLFRAFREPHLLTVEVSVDFAAGSGVDRKFVLRHGLFGRSRLDRERPYEDLRFGTRHSATMVRGYFKPVIDRYRVEVELHSSWLRQFRLRYPDDLAKLGALLMPNRVQFVKIDLNSLAAYLSGKNLPVGRIINRVRCNASSSLGHALEYIRIDVGLSNVRRFLIPLNINHVIERKLRAWAEHWRSASDR